MDFIQIVPSWIGNSNEEDVEEKEDTVNLGVWSHTNSKHDARIRTKWNEIIESSHSHDCITLIQEFHSLFQIDAFPWRILFHVRPVDSRRPTKFNCFFETQRVDPQFFHYLVLNYERTIPCMWKYVEQTRRYRQFLSKKKPFVLDDNHRRKWMSKTKFPFLKDRCRDELLKDFRWWKWSENSSQFRCLEDLFFQQSDFFCHPPLLLFFLDRFVSVEERKKVFGWLQAGNNDIVSFRDMIVDPFSKRYHPFLIELFWRQDANRILFLFEELLCDETLKVENSIDHWMRKYIRSCEWIWCNSPRCDIEGWVSQYSRKKLELEFSNSNLTLQDGTFVPIIFRNNARIAQRLLIQYLEGLLCLEQHTPIEKRRLFLYPTNMILSLWTKFRSIVPVDISPESRTRMELFSEKLQNSKTKPNIDWKVFLSLFGYPFVVSPKYPELLPIVLEIHRHEVFRKIQYQAFLDGIDIQHPDIREFLTRLVETGPSNDWIEDHFGFLPVRLPFSSRCTKNPLDCERTRQTWILLTEILVSVLPRAKWFDWWSVDSLSLIVHLMEKYPSLKNLRELFPTREELLDRLLEEKNCKELLSFIQN